jgi:hypothetical protein
MIDSLIAFRILYLLVTPFKESKAFKLGIIDENGKLLKKPSEFKTTDEKDAYNMLMRLVFNLKRLLIQLPGGDAKLKNIAAAYFLVKENIKNRNVDTDLIQEQLEFITNENIVLVEETATVLNFLKFMENEGGAPVNSTGPMVSTDEPVINRKKRPIHYFRRKSV